MPTGPKGEKRPADVIGNAVKLRHYPFFASILTLRHVNLAPVEKGFPMRTIIIGAVLLGSLSAASATTCGDGSFSYARRGACSHHHGGIARSGGYERHGYRYWDGPWSDEGTRYLARTAGPCIMATNGLAPVDVEHAHGPAGGSAQ
jgi:hypothetical protein